jgi:hypothetical protein
VILDRQAGVDMSRTTLDGWMMQVGEMLRPLVLPLAAKQCHSAYLYHGGLRSALLTSNGLGWCRFSY